MNSRTSGSLTGALAMTALLGIGIFGRLAAPAVQAPVSDGMQILLVPESDALPTVRSQPHRKQTPTATAKDQQRIPATEQQGLQELLQPQQQPQQRQQQPFAVDRNDRFAEYLPATLLSERPRAMSDIDAELSARFAYIHTLSMTLILLISEYGDVDKVLITDAPGDDTLPAVLRDDIAQRFLDLHFLPGRLHGQTVRTALKISVSLGR